MEELKKTTNTFQNIVLENREKLSVTGIIDVFSFDDQIIIIETELGLLTIKGEDGKINSLTYSGVEGANKKSKNVLSKIFK